jgi:hypothetical protein
MWFAGQTAPPAGVAVRPLEEMIVHVVSQSAYNCTCCSCRASLSSIVKPTIDGPGGFEMELNNKNAGSHMLHFFLEQ